MSDVPDELARRQRLVGAKLRGLVGDHLGTPIAESTDFSPGSALRLGGDGWVYLDDRPAERLGAALAWAIRSDVDALHVIADAGTGLLARRASQFDLPVTVWHVNGRTLAAAEPEPIAVPPVVPAHHEELRALIVEGGADPVVEWGVLTGEVRGLEVCRVVDDLATGATRLEVGVGAHDREAFQMLHGDVPAVESLTRVVAAVAQHRELGGPQHPLNTLAAERLIRWRIEQDPSIVGASVVEPAEPPVPRRNLKDPTPCVASGLADDGTPLTVVCSSGVDLDVIPYAADARLARLSGPGAGEGELVVAMPSRDRIAIVGEIAERLRQSASFVSVD